MPARAQSWSRPALVLILYLGLGATALVWSSLRGKSIWRYPDREELHVFAGVVAGLTLGLFFVFASRLAVYRFDWARQLHREFRALLGPLPDAEVFVLAVASSLGEEMFFRGALLPAIAGATGDGMGLVWSAALFALLHVGPRAAFLPWTISSFVAGFLFGLLFLVTGDLTGPVLAHFTVNFLNLRHVSAYDVR